MPDEFQYDVFLSHSAKDWPRVRKLAERLKKAGLDIVFYGAERYDGCHLDYIVKHAFVRHLESLRTSRSARLMKDKIEAGEQFRLCPVTRRILERFVRSNALPREALNN